MICPAHADEISLALPLAPQIGYEHGVSLLVVPAGKLVHLLLPARVTVQEKRPLIACAFRAFCASRTCFAACTPCVSLLRRKLRRCKQVAVRRPHLYLFALRFLQPFLRPGEKLRPVFLNICRLYLFTVTFFRDILKGVQFIHKGGHKAGAYQKIDKHGINSEKHRKNSYDNP